MNFPACRMWLFKIDCIRSDAAINALSCSAALLMSSVFIPAMILDIVIGRHCRMNKWQLHGRRCLHHGVYPCIKVSSTRWTIALTLADCPANCGMRFAVHCRPK